MKTIRCVTALLIGISADTALAATGNVIFNATVTPTCTIAVNSNGTMTVGADLQTLSAHNAGGQAGSVTVSTTGGVSLSVDPVTAVTAPAADTTTTSWNPTYAATGAQTIAETAAPTPITVPGAIDVSVFLAGVKSGSNRFVSGNYQATVTVRCQ